MLYGELHEMWVGRAAPKPITARMVRAALKHLARATGTEDWGQLPVFTEQHAIVLLDGALSGTKLRSQSRSNYRNYLRRLYRFAAQEKLDLGGAGNARLWPAAPNHDSVPRGAQTAYKRFVRWAIGQGIWPANVKPQHLLDWALAEKANSNLHWRKDYDHLQATWDRLAAESDLPGMIIIPLPPKLNVGYALPVEEWPAHLGAEWQRMCQDALEPLRKGGIRAWRPITQATYEKKLTLFLGWFVREHPSICLADQTWASLLSPDHCQAYLNWLVARTGKSYLNPAHMGFLRAVRGFHRFLLNGHPGVIQGLTDLCKRCEVEERDKAVRMAPFPVVEQAFRTMLAAVNDAAKPGRWQAIHGKTLAAMQVDVILFGLLTTRALRCANIIGMRIDQNLVRSSNGLELRYTSKEMKGHRKFETPMPAELVPVVDDYLRRGYGALTGRQPSTGDVLLVCRRGTPLDAGSLAQRVRRLTLKYVGKRLNPHLFRHIVATHAAQVWKMTPSELAAFLAHRSVLTVMKYYEVTNPARAAERFDEHRKGLGA